MNLEMATKAVDAYLEDANEAEAARLRFFLGLWEVQGGIAVADAPYEPIGPRAALELLSSGRHIFEVNSPAIGRDEYLDAISRVAHYVRDMAGLSERQQEGLAAMDFSALISDEDIATAAKSPSAFVSGVVGRASDTLDHGGLTSTTLAFVLILALTPFLVRSAALSMEALDFTVRRLEAPHVPYAARHPRCHRSVRARSTGEPRGRCGARHAMPSGTSIACSVRYAVLGRIRIYATGMWKAMPRTGFMCAMSAAGISGPSSVVRPPSPST